MKTPYTKITLCSYSVEYSSRKDDQNKICVHKNLEIYWLGRLIENNYNPGMEVVINKGEKERAH